MRSHVTLRRAVAAVCVAGLILVAASLPAGDGSGLGAGVSRAAGDWCPLGGTLREGRCCADDYCRSSYPALHRPAIADPVTTLSTPISGAEQSETTPGDPDATGTFTLTTKPGLSQVCFTISMYGMNLNAIVGHLHKAPRGQTNLVPSAELLENVNARNTISQCRFVDPVVLRDLRDNPNAYYVQVHNLDHPEGAIRGQLGD